MNTNQPQLLRKHHVKFNSLHRRLENWLVNYQSTLPIDAELMFEQLGLEYTRKNYKKFYGALWEINHDAAAKVQFSMKDFHFAEFPLEQKLTFINERAAGGNGCPYSPQVHANGVTVDFDNGAPCGGRGGVGYHGQNEVVIDRNALGGDGGGDTSSFVPKMINTNSPTSMDVLAKIYNQLQELPVDQARKIIQSLTIML